jgi:exodeoxyribonuclease X
MTELDLAPRPAIARVLDFETTGLPEDEAAEIIEAGFIDVDLTTDGFPIAADSGWSSLIKPVGDIPAVTMAVHHIMPQDVADAPGAVVAWQALAHGLTDADVLVAHKAEFEQHFYSKRPQSWICTHKCALRAWPDAPSHSNQGLRYHLGLPVDRVLANPPHRALPDAYVTAHILQELLKLRPLERLIEISGQPGFLPRMTLGEHYGKKFSEVPTGYLEWMVKKMASDPKRQDEVFTAKWWLTKHTRDQQAQPAESM